MGSADEKRFKDSSFLVKDDTLKYIECNFYRFLMSEGFELFYGNYGVKWAFVNISKKTFAYGRPGVGYVPVLFDHAITIDEFKIIYNIFKKYRSKNLMEF